MQNDFIILQHNSSNNGKYALRARSSYYSIQIDLKLGYVTELWFPNVGQRYLTEMHNA